MCIDNQENDILLLSIRDFQAASPFFKSVTKIPGIIKTPFFQNCGFTGKHTWPPDLITNIYQITRLCMFASTFAKV